MGNRKKVTHRLVKIAIGYTWLIISTVMLITACETDSYEKGEGRYSLMQADFCQLYVNNQKQAVSFTTDEGDEYQLSPVVTAKWIETADTTYRAMIYYNKVGTKQAKSLMAAAVVTLHPVEHWRFKQMPQDPIGFESAWLTKNKRYLNVGLLIKTGRIDDEEQPHNIGLAQDTVLVGTDQKRTACYRLLHSQNTIPQYYTNRRYISIALPQPAPDTIRFSLQTYDGIIEKVFY